MVLYRDVLGTKMPTKAGKAFLIISYFRAPPRWFGLSGNAHGTPAPTGGLFVFLGSGPVPTAGKAAGRPTFKAGTVHG